MSEVASPVPETVSGEANADPEAQGDIRRGGWILVLAGVLLVLVALAFLLLR